MKTIIVIAGALLLAACGSDGGVRVETQYKTLYVPTPAPCPKVDVYEALVASRPKPLVSQPMPPTAEERNAKTSAQLGRYEARGGWADKVQAALDRCQAKGLATPG